MVVGSDALGAVFRTVIVIMALCYIPLMFFRLKNTLREYLSVIVGEVFLCLGIAQGSYYYLSSPLHLHTVCIFIGLTILAWGATMRQRTVVKEKKRQATADDGKASKSSSEE